MIVVVIKLLLCLLETPANERPELYERGEIIVNLFLQNLNIKDK